MTAAVTDGPLRAEGRAPLWLWGIVAAIALAAGLRLAGIFDDFWFDEIWSWRIARSLHGALDALTSPAAHIDNNHPLNTMLLYWLGDRAYWPVYRVPSLLAGVATVALATWHMARRHGRVEAVATAVLLGASYPMVVYSSEARGYALMVFFAAVCFVAMDRYLQKRSWASAAIFVVAAALGFLSHLTFAHFYLAAMVWSGLRLVRDSRSWGAAAIDFARCHVVPVAFAGWLYVVFVARITIGGAPDTSLWGVVASSLSLMGGGSDATTPFTLLTAAALILSLAVVWRHRRDLFWFYLVCLILSPAAFVLLQAVSMRGMETLFPRYFLISMAFGYLLVATAIETVWRRRGGRAAVIVLLSLYAAASLWQTSRFLRGTRGHYLDAVRYMVDHSPGGTATVTGDNAFRTELLLGFYARYVPADESITYTPPPPAGAPEWLIVNTPQAGVEPRQQLVVGGVPYDFDREFTYHGLSGWSWYLFRRPDGTAR